MNIFGIDLGTVFLLRRITFNNWKLLNIEPTDNVKDIKAAFGKRAKIYYPEVYPEEYKELYKAYKQALSYAKSVKGRNKTDILMDGQVSISVQNANENRSFEHLVRKNEKFDLTQIKFQNNNTDAKTMENTKAAFDFNGISGEAKRQDRNAQIKKVDNIALWQMENFFKLKQSHKLRWHLGSGEFIFRMKREEFALQVYNYFAENKNLNKKAWKETVIPEMREWAAIWEEHPLNDKFLKLCGKVKKGENATR